MKYIAHVKTPKVISITVEAGGKYHTRLFNSNSAAYPKLVNLLKKGVANLDTKKLQSILSPPKAKKEVPEALKSRASMEVTEHLPTQPLNNFIKRLNKNPDKNSRDQLLNWVTKHGVTLLPDGRMLLYKRVQSNFKSHHDGITDHSVGKQVQIDRAQCSSDPTEACAPGLHCTSYRLLDEFYGNVAIELIVDPEHVVRVPHSEQKIAACSYYVNRQIKADNEVQEGLYGKENPTTSEPLGSGSINIKGEKVTFPAKFLLLAGFKAGDTIALTEESGTVVIEMAKQGSNVTEEGTLRVRVGMFRKIFKRKMNLNVRIFSKRLVVSK